ncbi:MAG: EAL domain-containing protein [Gammaproteobacteria bacterium]|nr:EAL domain-containing protein [Gammaproteobacteria bacterium]MBU1624227.1 EAL domain-containing protein [Gammaproteobacteria bacterium]MBU1981955.1 EAL domain-containing protein [Gammaproteobacteria bacterium]
MAATQTTDHSNLSGYLLKVLLLASAYFVTGRLGLDIPYVGSQITLYWLPTGIAVAALLRWGGRYWPGIFIGAALVNFSINPSLLLAVGIALGNTLAPLLAMWLLQRTKFNLDLTHPKDIAKLIPAAFAGMLVSALNGIGMLLIAGAIPLEAALRAFISWWMGDAVGVLLATPLLLTVNRSSLLFLMQRQGELLAWFSLMLALSWIAFIDNTGDHNLPLAFLPFPLIVWAGMRFGMTGSPLAVVLLSYIAAWSTSLDRGPFSLHGAQGLFLLWAFMITLAVVGLIITALWNAHRKSEYRSNLLLDSVSNGVWGLDTQGNTIFVNAAAGKMLGYSTSELMGKPMHATVHHSYPDGSPYPRDACPMHATFQDGMVRTVADEVLWRKDGSSFPVEYSSTPLYNEGELVGSVVVFQDITERKAAEELQRIAAAAFETHEAIMITDANANLIRVNKAFEEITGYFQEEVIGKNPRMLSSGRQDQAFYTEMWEHLLAQGSWTGEIWDKRKNGEIYPKWLTITAIKDSNGKTTGYVATFSDISLRKKAEDEIYSLAFYDHLTKLPNRRHLIDRITQSQSISARSKHYGALLFLDMDRFKILNDTLGHDVGDMFLIEVARRLRQCVRDMDTVARIGGDEFVVLIEEIGLDAEDASQKVALIAEKVRTSLSAPYLLDNHEHHSSSSIGVCLYRGNEAAIDILLKYADMAMYQAKESGRNAVRFYDPAMQQAVETRAALEADLRHAITDKQLHLYYQIQVDNERRPIGAEALIRWIHPQRGMVSPMQFIPIAEESSLILDVGQWVLETACQQLSQWRKLEQTKDLTLAVNVSAAQFKKHDFVNNVAALLNIHNIVPDRLKLELTEAVVLDDVADVVTKMHALKALGVRLSLDDFGTGYSSLSYLKQLPLDQIKIDQSFVRDIGTDPSDAVMVQTIINLAESFRLNVIAEGVETEPQLNFLRQNGCMAYQGYLFSKPVPLAEFEALLHLDDSQQALHYEI